MVGAVLKGCEEEPNVTRHRPMWDDWLLLHSNWSQVPSCKIRGSEKQWETENGGGSLCKKHRGTFVELCNARVLKECFGNLLIIWNLLSVAILNSIIISRDTNCDKIVLLTAVLWPCDGYVVGLTWTSSIRKLKIKQDSPGRWSDLMMILISGDIRRGKT